MTKEKSKIYNPFGRAKGHIDWSQFEKLCALQCSQVEIASILNISPGNLRDRVQDYYQHPYDVVCASFREVGKVSLRRNQFKMSEQNAAMAIWLGKQWLGQKEQAQVMEVPIELKKNFEDLMSQIRSTQKDLNMEDKSNKTEANSA